MSNVRLSLEMDLGAVVAPEFLLFSLPCVKSFCKKHEYVALTFGIACAAIIGSIKIVILPILLLLGIVALVGKMAFRGKCDGQTAADVVALFLCPILLVCFVGVCGLALYNFSMLGIVCVAISAISLGIICHVAKVVSNIEETIFTK